MKLAVGCDHAGFPLKARVLQEIRALGHEAFDCGCFDETACDYPDYARKVGERIVGGQAERGIIVCGSGVGVSVAANKIPGVRAAMCHDTYSARQGVEHDSMNCLCIGWRVIGPEVAAEVVRAYLGATFSGVDRHVRRLEKVLAIERDARAGAFDAGRAGKGA